jgi:metal-responsive CopG/Arc/MetJ family transcriptional regulator
MSQTKYRAQILLEPEQHQALSEIATRHQKSISHVVREIIQDYLVERDLDNQQRQEIQAIQTLAQIRQEIQAQHGLIHTDILAEARTERDAELEERGALSP